MTPSSAALAVSLLACVVAFVVLRARLGRALPPSFAEPRGSAAAGERWALTAAFLPWNKESARLHPLSYAAGLVLHLGVLAMLVRLGWSLTDGRPPRVLELLLAAVLTAALACGLGLFVKRAIDPALRALSAPEDYFANLLVGTVLALGLAACLDARMVSPFQWAGAALLVYAPLGKLRHMVFLVTSRRFWGRFFGRRGVKGAAREVARG